MREWVYYILKTTMTTMWHSQPDSVGKIMTIIRIVNLEKDTRRQEGNSWQLVAMVVSLYDWRGWLGRRKRAF